MANARIQLLKSKLFQPIDGSSVYLFRILFGLAMLYQAKMLRDHVETRFLHTTFKFPFFDFARLLPGDLPYYELSVMMIAACLLTLGLFFRFAAVVWFVGFTHFFLIDKTHYQNHYYLIVLFSFLMIFTSADRGWSLDALRKKPDSVAIPFWNLFLLRAQLVIVYFYAGVAKLNGDWLGHAQPIGHWLSMRSDLPIVGPLLEERWVHFFIAHAGATIDLSVGFLLLNRRSRPFAITVLILFHSMNSVLFEIGIFPPLMLATLVLFIEPETPRRYWQRLRGIGRKAAEMVPAVEFTALDTSQRKRIAVFSFVLIYLSLQVLIPLRHHLIPGPVAWTEEGHRFSWRMMLRSKRAVAIIVLIDPETNEETLICSFCPEDYLSPKQDRKVSRNPDMLFDYAQHIKELGIQRGIKNPVVNILAMSSLNGRPYQRIIDPTVNFAELENTFFGHSEWILPMQEGLEVGLFAGLELVAD